MKRLVKSKKGITLVELMVSITLLVALLGIISMIFFSTSRIYSDGTSQIKAKELSNLLFQAIESKLKYSNSIELKNSDLTDDSLKSTPTTVSHNGEELVDFSEQLLTCQTKFTKKSNFVLGIHMQIYTASGKKIYEQSRVLKLQNLEFGKKAIIALQEDGEYIGIIFA